jgi:tetratricopeptide (TPR) repeat protein/tRNA A-37 threonylcarbamoyl transferase component Bud32
MKVEHSEAAEPSPDRERELIRAAQREAAVTHTPDSPSHACVPSPDHVAIPFDPEPPATLSDSLPGYEVIREIHRGGQGVVYQAVQKSTKRRVAIKLMREGPFSDARDLARFEREVRILGALTHPNIVNIHDSGTAGGRFYFVMDYISGLPLDRYMAAQQRSIPETLRLFARICEAVNAAHLRGVIHRDLKPGNIRIDSEGEPHVLDFGLAKLATGEVTDASHPQVMTETGRFVGTPPWASPEQAEGAPHKVDIRTDVYSLGVILFQMLTGTFPYEVVGNRSDVLNNIISATPARPSSFRREIDGDVETIVLKCLAKERERRYQSAGELARDVRHYLAGEPIEARRDSAAYVVGKLVARHRRSAVKAVVILLAFCAIIYWAAGASRQRRTMEAHALLAERGNAVAKAQLLLSQSEYEAAIETIGPVLTRDPRDIEAILIHTYGLWRTKRGEEAEIELRAACMSAPDDAAVRFLLATIVGTSDPARAAQLLSDARRLQKDTGRDYYLRALAEQDDGQAIELLTRTLEWNAGDFEALTSRCIRYFKTKAYAQMQEDADRAVRLRPKDVVAWHNLGTAFLYLNQNEKSLAALRRATELDNGFVLAWHNLGLGYQRCAQWQPAIEAFTRCVQLNPKRAADWELLAQIHLQLEEFGASKAAWQRVLDLQPENWGAVYHLALCQSSLGEFEQALSGFQRRLRGSREDKSTVLLMLADTHWRLGQAREALEASLQVLDLEPDDPDALNIAAWTLLTGGGIEDASPSGALEYAQRATTLRPDDPTLWNTLALAEVRAGEFTSADAHIARALALSQSPDAWTLALRARTALESGEREEARRNRNAAVQLAETYSEPDAPALKSFLRELDERMREFSKEQEQ